MTNVTSASEWKKNRKQQELKLPSGNTCLVKPVGLDALLQQGNIPNSLLDIVQTALAKGKAGRADEIDESQLLANLMGDQDKIKDVFEMADVVTAACVLEPSVRFHRYTQQDLIAGQCSAEQVGVVIPDDQRSDDILYTDEVDLDDKMFIMQFAVGGTRDLERFREATAPGVGAVPER